MKKLLFITPSFPRDETESHIIPFLQHVFLGFNERYPDVEVTIVAIHKPLTEPYQWYGMKVIPLKGNNVAYPQKIFFLCRSFYRLRKLIRKEQFDGILNLWYNDFSVFTHAIHRKTFTWMLGQDVRKSNIYLRLFKPDPDKIMALSEFNNNVLFETAGIRAHQVIPMAINEHLFPELNTGPRPIDVFAAGNFNEVKNYKLLVEAIGHLKERFPNLKAELAGIGEQETELKQLAKAKNLEQNLTFLGQIPHRETLDKMNNAKIFLHTSTFEGGSTVYFESLFSGCQLVGTLPMIDREVANFHLCKTQSEIIDTIRGLLENPKPVQRIRYYSMEYCCDAIYNLFTMKNEAI